MNAITQVSRVSRKPTTGSDQSRCRGRLRRQTASSTPRTDKSRIQWPTAQELQRVSITLAKVSRSGMRHEGAGDYFTSGDLAYQLKEIIRATDDLLKRSQRTKTQPTPAIRD